MPNVKARKMITHVSSCRRRLRRIMIENGENFGEEGTGTNNRDFEALVEELRGQLEEIKKIKEERDTLKNKNDGEAARKYHEYNVAVREAKNIVRQMKANVQGLEKKVEKADRKGQTETEKYQQKKQELQRKQNVIEMMTQQLEQLEASPEREMAAPEAAMLTEAREHVKAFRSAMQRDDVMGGAPGGSSDAVSPDDVNISDADREQFQMQMRQIEQGRKEEDELLTKLSYALTQLKERSRTIGDQIDKSLHNLDDLDKRTDATRKDLRSLTRSVNKALNDVNNTSYFTNIGCFLLLLALVGVVVYYVDPM
eukprot:Sspe_Gene.63612::Locus_36668_Transcript_1_1_Confidence_1.000_Length_1181::g.63612::m.63612